MRPALRGCRVVEPAGPQRRGRVGRGVGAGRAGAYGRGSGRGASRVRRSRPNAGRQAGSGCSVRTIGRLGWAYASAKERPAPPQTAPPVHPRPAGRAGPGFGRAGARRRSLGGAGRCRAAGASPSAARASVHDARQRRHRRHSPAAADSRDRHTPRADTDISPSSPHRRPTPPFRPVPTPNSSRPGPPPPPRRLHGSPTGPHNTHQPTHHALPLPRCRRPAPGPLAPAWAARPGFTWRVEEGGPARSGGPPSSKAQAQSGEQVGAGRRPVRA
jgi:hypothetical protein